MEERRDPKLIKKILIVIIQSVSVIEHVVSFCLVIIHLNF